MHILEGMGPKVMLKSDVVVVVEAKFEVALVKMRFETEVEGEVKVLVKPEGEVLVETEVE